MLGGAAAGWRARPRKSGRSVMGAAIFRALQPGATLGDRDKFTGKALNRRLAGGLASPLDAANRAEVYKVAFKKSVKFFKTIHLNKK